MILQQVALVSEVQDISFSEVSRVSAALQKQATRDFGPIWNVKATVDAFPSLNDVPAGYWPIIVQTDIQEEGALGIHLDKSGQPYALVQYGETWSLTASHECLEMLADPFGRRLVAGKSIKKGQGRVEYLMEVCDPCEAIGFAYTINGVTVSDFYTPHYFEPIPAANVRYSFSGAIKKPLTVLKGGYLSWHDSVTDHWWQANFLGAKLIFKDFGRMARIDESLRTTINKATPDAFAFSRPKGQPLMAARAMIAAVSESANAKANQLRAEILAMRARVAEEKSPFEK